MIVKKSDRVFFDHVMRHGMIRLVGRVEGVFRDDAAEPDGIMYHTTRRRG